MLKLKSEGLARGITMISSCLAHFENVKTRHYGSRINNSLLFSNGHANYGLGYYLYLEETFINKKEIGHDKKEIIYYNINNGDFILSNIDGFELIKRLGIFPESWNLSFKGVRSSPLVKNVLSLIGDNVPELKFGNENLEYEWKFWFSKKLLENNIDGIWFKQKVQDCVVVVNPNVISEINI